MVKAVLPCIHQLASAQSPQPRRQTARGRSRLWQETAHSPPNAGKLSRCRLTYTSGANGKHLLSTTF